MWKLNIKALVLSLLIFLLVACESEVKPEFKSTDITGASFGQDFQLVDHKGVARSLSDYKDKVAVIFFGYTQCPDMCPATMGILAETVKKLGEDAKRVQVLFVTLDPEQDTPEILEQYLSYFDAEFIGLTGDKKEIDAVTEGFKVYSQNKMQENGDYSVDHSTGTYIFDTDGKIRLYVRYGNGEEIFLHDIKLLLKES